MSGFFCKVFIAYQRRRRVPDLVQYKMICPRRTMHPLEVELLKAEIRHRLENEYGIAIKYRYKLKSEWMTRTSPPYGWQRVWR